MLILLGAATVIVAGSSVDRLGPYVLQARPVANYACAGTAPETCVPADYRELLSGLDSVARPVLASLEARLGPLPVERLVAFSLASPAKGAAVIPVYLEPPFTDELNVALSVVKAATGCPSSAPIDHDVSLIVAGTVPRLRGWAAGAAGIDLADVPDQAGARSRFEALVDGCAP
jgi:hypothetical protein